MSSMPASEAENKDGMAWGNLGKLAEALAKAQGSFEPIGKDKTAKVQGKEGRASYTYKYADLADVLASVRKALASNGLALVQRIMRDAAGLYLETRLIHSSGQTIAAEYPLPGSSGKPQEMGSAITYARRYSLCSLLGISPDEDDDGREAQDAHERERAQPEAHEPTVPQRIVSYARSCGLTDAAARGVLESLGFKSTRDVPEDRLEEVFRAFAGAEAGNALAGEVA